MPAGKYKTIIVSMEMNVMGTAIKLKSWFADKVGIVKQVQEVAGVVSSSELVKFELRK